MHLQQIDRRGEKFPALATAHLQQIIVLQAESKSNQQTKKVVEGPLHRVGRTECSRG